MRLVMATVLTGMIGCSLGRTPLLGAAPAASPSPIVLNLHLTSTQPLSDAAFDAMAAATESIWRPAHVQVRWVDRDVQNATQLRVVVMARLIPGNDPRAPWAVGELVTHDGLPPMAIASVTGARRIVDSTSRFRLLDSASAQERGLGVVLGRAIAHEVGHFLLRTKTHASSGLMRAFIDAREFADPATNGFRLDKAAMAHMTALATAASRSADHSRLTPFSY